jgi:predicted transposase YdaD
MGGRKEGREGGRKEGREGGREERRKERREETSANAILADIIPRFLPASLLLSSLPSLPQPSP